MSNMYAGYSDESELREYLQNLAKISGHIRGFISNIAERGEVESYRDVIEAYNRFCDVLDILNERVGSEPDGPEVRTWNKISVQFPVQSNG